MRGSGTAARLMLVLLCAAGLSACRDNGLPDRNLPLDEARNRQYGYTVYEPSTDNPPIAFGGRHWIRTMPVEEVPSRLLVQVANVDGTLLFARRGEEAPHSRLYSPAGNNRWIAYVRLN